MCAPFFSDTFILVPKPGRHSYWDLWAHPTRAQSCTPDCPFLDLQLPNWGTHLRGSQSFAIADAAFNTSLILSTDLAAMAIVTAPKEPALWEFHVHQEWQCWQKHGQLGCHRASRAVPTSQPVPTPTKTLTLIRNDMEEETTTPVP
ncbi:hypothetical protein GW7_00669 [Heterocephalus glaber]|uniref:Uncharacterized protein n=1 Tax=Heterocephalus glaber TaxID=10181 RepID=G5C3X4_HETGA|nr:hypothetical protein GW7_00669 [Heterocephalus glaber]